jgi:hypothetical protein
MGSESLLEEISLASVMILNSWNLFELSGQFQNEKIISNLNMEFHLQNIMTQKMHKHY